MDDDDIARLYAQLRRDADASAPHDSVVVYVLRAVLDRLEQLETRVLVQDERLATLECDHVQALVEAGRIEEARAEVADLTRRLGENHPATIEASTYVTVTVGVPRG